MTGQSDIQRLYSLKEAAALIDPDGQIGITDRSLRTEIDNGRLIPTRIAGKFAIAYPDLLAFLEVARVVPPTSETPQQPVDAVRRAYETSKALKQTGRRRPGEAEARGQAALDKLLGRK